MGKVEYEIKPETSYRVIRKVTGENYSGSETLGLYDTEKQAQDAIDALALQDEILG